MKRGDQLTATLYDAFIAEQWKAPVPKHRSRGSCVAWNRLASGLKVPIDDHVKVQQLSEAALQFLDEQYPGILAVTPVESAPLASVQRALDLWYGHAKTDVGDKEDMVGTVGVLLNHVRHSYAVTAREAVQVSGAAGAKKKAPPVRSMPEPSMEELFEEDEEHEPGPVSVRPATVKRELAAMALTGPKRIYDGLPPEEDPSVLPESVLMRPEMWITISKERIRRELSAYFLDVPSSQYNRAVMAELKAAMEKELPWALDELFYAMRNAPSTIFPYSCRVMDQRLGEYMRKKILAKHGPGKASQYVHQCRMVDANAPLIVKNAHAILAKDFQSPAQTGTSGMSGTGTA